MYLKFAGKKYRSLAPHDELCFLFGLIGMFIGAKTLSLLCVFPEFISELKYAFTETELFIKKYLLSGFVFYGGLYGALLGVFVYAKSAKCSFSELLSMMFPVVPMIHAFGRLGCFCTGCCYGIQSEHFGICFSHSEIAPNGIPLFPVQLCEAVLEFALFAVLLAMMLRHAHGFKMLGLYLTVYGAFRFAFEFLRGDSARGFIGVLSVSQVISIVTVAWGIFLLLKSRKQKTEIQ